MARWPPTEAEFLLVIKALWWFESCGTLESDGKIMSDICIAACDRKAASSGVAADANFRAATSPIFLHRNMYLEMNHVLRRHVEHGVRRVEPVRGVGEPGQCFPSCI